MEKVRREKMQVRKKVGKSRFTVFLQWFGAPEGRKVTSLKRRVRSHLARWEMKSCTPLWREAHFQVKSVKNLQSQTTFGSCDVEKVHTGVARITFVSKRAKSTSRSDHFWKLRCRKSARRCGAKHISKSKCAKHSILRPLLEAEMSKKCTPLWREAHIQVKMYKTHQRRTTLGSRDVERVHAVVARSTFPSQNVQSTRGSDHFLTFRCRKSARRWGAKHISKSKVSITESSGHFWTFRCRPPQQQQQQQQPQPQPQPQRQRQRQQQQQQQLLLLQQLQQLQQLQLHNNYNYNYDYNYNYNLTTTATTSTTTLQLHHTTRH